ncbi:putative pheromone receptor [Lyophyllum shimeji]|uniref:Pheromone receptor n=1 Tax=Lyophyllum shimeji TaxID=47721 RepID=A0A9P3PJT2_LYOSH|nr:putative pheromone receptor [Lyophyllum shimeji]
MPADTALLSVVSFIAFVLALIPFPWHLQAWNTGTCLFMAWASLGSLVYFINSVVWRGNTVNWSPVWCDITTKFMIGTALGLPAASLCVQRRMYHIASIRTVTETRVDRRRAIISDLSIGLGLPVLFMILHYIVQGHRFDIFEDIGCTPSTYNTPLAYLLVDTPPLIFGLLSTIYAILSIIAFKRRNLELKALLSTGSGPSANRYLRLICLAGTVVLTNTPLMICGIAVSAQGDVQPWVSWEDTHFNFSRVERIPAILWRADPALRFFLEGARWAMVLCGLFFFGFFGFAEEARRNYRAAYNSIASRLGAKIGEKEKGSSKLTFKVNVKFGTERTSSPTTKVETKQEATLRRVPLDSISTSTLSFQFQDVGGLLSDSTLNLSKGEAGARATASSLKDTPRLSGGGWLSDLRSSDTTAVSTAPTTERGAATTRESMYGTRTADDRGVNNHIQALAGSRRPSPSPPLRSETPATTRADQDIDLERGPAAEDSFLDLSETPTTAHHLCDRA